jgi:hypothetical protein
MPGGVIGSFSGKALTNALGTALSSQTSSLGGGGNPLQALPDLIKEIDDKGKKLSPKSFLGGLLGALLPPQFSGLLDQENQSPFDLPIAGVVSMAAGMLTDASAPKDLQAFWGQSAIAAKDDVGSTIPDLTSQFSQALSIIGNIPTLSSNLIGVQAAAEAAQFFLGLPAANSGDARIIRSQLENVCQAFGPSSRAVYAAYDNAGALRNSIGALTETLDISSLLLGSAANAESSARVIAGTFTARQLASNGVVDTSEYINRIFGLSQAQLGYSDPCDRPMEQLTVMRAACQLVDGIYSGIGNGAVNWNSLPQEFGQNLLFSGIPELSLNSSRLTGFTGNGITDPILGAMNGALSAAVCNSDKNMAVSELQRVFETQMNRAIAGSGSVATLYGNTQDFTGSIIPNGLNVMRLLGAGGGFSMLQAGSIADFFQSSISNILGISDKISSLRELAKSVPGGVGANVIEDQIRSVISKSNVAGFHAAGPGDAVHSFVRAQALNLLAANKLKSLFVKP